MGRVSVLNKNFHKLCFYIYLSSSIGVSAYLLKNLLKPIVRLLSAHACIVVYVFAA